MSCFSRLQVLKKNNKNSQIYLQSKTVSYYFHVQVAHSRKSFPSRLLFYCCSRNVKPCWISLWLFLNFIPRNVGNATKPGLVKRSQTGIKRVVWLLESGVCLVWKNTDTSHLLHHGSIIFSAADLRTNSPSDVGGQKEAGLGCITNGI